MRVAGASGSAGWDRLGGAGVPGDAADRPSSIRCSRCLHGQGSPRSYMKKLVDQTLSGNEVYYTARSLRVILTKSCSKLHCQRVLISTPSRIRSRAKRGQLKISERFQLKNGSRRGLDCLDCAEFARQWKPSLRGAVCPRGRVMRSGMHARFLVRVPSCVHDRDDVFDPPPVNMALSQFICVSPGSVLPT